VFLHKGTKTVTRNSAMCLAATTCGRHLTPNFSAEIGKNFGSMNSDGRSLLGTTYGVGCDGFGTFVRFHPSCAGTTFT
jgi:hypothetical protein